MGFSQRKTDWHFYWRDNSRICGSVEKPEQDWQDHLSTEFVSRGICGIKKTMSGTEVTRVGIGPGIRLEAS